MSSFDSQPEKGGRPVRARPPTINETNVNGRTRRKPPIRSSDWTPAMAPISDPAAMNRSALKKACVIRWNIAAE